MQPLGSPLLEFLLFDGLKSRKGIAAVWRDSWQGYRRGGVGGALIGFATAVVSARLGGPGNYNALVDNFRNNPGSDPIMRQVLSQLTGGNASPSPDDTIGALPAQTGLSRAEIAARVAKFFPSQLQ